MLETHKIVNELIQHHSFKGAVPFLFGGVYSAIQFENELHALGLPWRSLHDRLSPDSHPDEADSFPRGRRYLTMIRQRDLEAAHEICERLEFKQQTELPVHYLGRLICMPSHDYEIEPCSYCKTGFDWWGASDDAEAEKLPPRHPNSSLEELES